ncbi:hypothetical protein J437_LFUL002712 [Ladona fulva]|uniref:Dedicator of cytokinesis C/D N-terminal domain-containing protein n=1 Tax=Ladona fulva TaxID=123851 RepID=A0A8K0JVH3_LADFU|nr:hypothetical protein J437_LFUL002712 [Ladona fulva]
MASAQRAFAQKLSKHHAADVRRQISSSSYSRSLTKSDSNVSGFSSSVSLCDIVDPLDYEDFIQQHQLLVDRDPLRHVLDFPVNDVEVGVLPRKIRTLTPITPSESMYVFIK